MSSALQIRTRVILEGDSTIAVIIISTLLHFQLSGIIKNSKGTFPYIQLSTLPDLSAGVGWVAGGGKTAYFHISTQIFANLSIQGIFPHFHTSTVGNLSIQDIFTYFHISTFPHFNTWNLIFSCINLLCSALIMNNFAFGSFHSDDAFCALLP